MAVRAGSDRRGTSRIVGAEFHKHYPEDLSLEFEKALVLYEISKRHAFTAPRPLRMEQETGSIAFERLSGLRSVRERYLEYVCATNAGDGARVVFRECGRVLSAIHRDLELSRTDEWRPTRHFDDRAGGIADGSTAPRGVFLHGDFGFANVFVIEGEAGIAVLDASPNYFVTFSPACHGPAFLDLGNMLSCMDGLVPWTWHLRMRLGRVRELETAFVDGYEAASGATLDRALLAAFTESTSLTYLQSRMKSRLLGRLGHFVLYNPLRRSRLRPIL